LAGADGTLPDYRALSCSRAEASERGAARLGRARQAAEHTRQGRRLVSATTPNPLGRGVYLIKLAVAFPLRLNDGLVEGPGTHEVKVIALGMDRVCLGASHHWLRRDAANRRATRRRALGMGLMVKDRS
jgi:hypothetical protein